MKKALLILLFILFIPFTVKAESNYLYDVIKSNESYKYLEYTGEHEDSLIKDGNKKIYYWHYSNYNYPSTFNNNVIFGNFCWLIVRTTDTGGVKIIYNGVPKNQKCIDDYREGITSYSKAIGSTSFNSKYNSPAYLGYMYNPDNIFAISYNESPNSGSLYGKSVTYNNGKYKLVNTSNVYDAEHHYTCNTESDTCEKVYYYYNFTESKALELSNGKNFEEALSETLNSENVNKVDSSAKEKVDTWYSNNMTEYTKYLEDVIFCNDRTINLYLNNNQQDYNIYVGKKDSLKCDNITDKFSISNDKAKLNYPVGLLTYYEASMSGTAKTTYLHTGIGNWLMTPGCFACEHGTAESSYIFSAGYIDQYKYVYESVASVRPVVSLRPNIKYVSGNGTQEKPYIIDYEFHKLFVLDSNETNEYSINVEDKNNIFEGDLVSIKFTPEGGFTVDNIEIKDGNNNIIEYRKTNKDNEFEFVMPDSDVTIKPSYRKIDLNNVPDILENPNTGDKLLIILLLIITILGIGTLIKKEKNLD